jgi:DNA-binding XRE family transcriptional regulator
MSDIQFIEHHGRREYAIVPMALFERMAAALEELDDVALYDAAKASDDGLRVPGSVLHAMIDGVHPVKAWRDYRGLTQEMLANAVGISKAFLCQIENGKRKGSIATTRAIAEALKVSMESL